VTQCAQKGDTRARIWMSFIRCGTIITILSGFALLVAPSFVHLFGYSSIRVDIWIHERAVAWGCLALLCTATSLFLKDERLITLALILDGFLLFTIFTSVHWMS